MASSHNARVSSRFRSSSRYHHSHHESFHHTQQPQDHATMVDAEKLALHDSPQHNGPARSSWRQLASGASFDNSFSSSYPKPSPQPLINFVKNGWKTASSSLGKARRGQSFSSNGVGGDGGHHKPAGLLQVVLAMITAPRFRRYIIVYLCLICLCFCAWVGFLSGRIREYADLTRALSLQNKAKVGGWFGTNGIPRFTDMVHMRTLDPSLLPGSTELTAGDPNRKRLIVVGDVHGCLDELQKLLEQVSFDPQRGDHLIFTGDLISKGPKSLEAVDFARKHRASCVRGNNEDRVLLIHREMKAMDIRNQSPQGRDEQPDKALEDNDTDTRERLLARKLEPEQAEWLDGCPVILKLGQIMGMGEVVVVHAGLVPGVALEYQDPLTVMSMRTLDVDTHVPSSASRGTAWNKIFNKYQMMQLSSTQLDSANPPTPTTVIYGHDVNRSPDIKKYTKGLDTGCVRGGQLSAMVIEGGGASRIEQVGCKDYRARR
ncbi:hypothetical protein AJ80_09516 [Polytolypa hystricis UAMH7299]|uniref:Calcineurin-like phosphoesterase domain-containing protein n=1 Tax=Polytolypa hystricis (strain UAMH7299) TaxID=1447883 RepID=A0A2B7WPX8_POLH7|nr:hypothetical protein AJ80_09516 [Polytolypa hystricis UAMH7299]